MMVLELIHIAPAYGEYATIMNCAENDVPVLSLVDGDGNYTGRKEGRKGK